VLTPNETSGNVISLPRPGDGFIAETAVKLDRLQAMLVALDQDTRDSKKALSDLTEMADRGRRMQALEESLRNARDYKLDEMVRSCRELKSRLDHIEGKRATYAALPHNTFEQVNEQLAQLASLKTAVAASEKRVRFNGILFCAALFLLVMLPLYNKFI
jgi:DNA repair exonuclease SbcCD ATPase subunit